MKTITSLLWLIGLLAAQAEEILIPQDRIKIDINHAEKPYFIAGQRLERGEDAAALITHIYDNWTLKKRPVLVVESHTKAQMPGEEHLYSAITKLAKKWKLRVIHMPAPHGFIPDSWIEAQKHVEGWNSKRK